MERPARPQDVEMPPWRDRVASLRRVPELLALVWNTHPWYAVIIVVIRIARATLPLAMLWVAKLIIDQAIHLAGQTGPALPRELLWLVAIEFGLAIVGEALVRGSLVLETLLAELFGNAMSARIMSQAATLDLAHFENAEFYDQLERARQQTTARVGMFVQVLETAQDLVTLVLLSSALIAFDPRLVALLVVAVLPTLVAETHLAALGYALLFRYTPQRRELDYLRYVGAGDFAAKEVKLFGLGSWLVKRYRDLSSEYYEESRRLTLRRALVGVALAAVVTAAYYLAYVAILRSAIAGAITIGSLTFLAASFARGRDLLRRVIGLVSNTAEQALYLRDLFSFLETRPTIVSRKGASPVRLISSGFAFENVGFRYPGTERWVVRNLDLALRPRESVALVGENGAGKTTVVKLLARLYDPTEGRITLDGIDLRDYDLASLHSSLGVIFQDFVRYDMTAYENIAVARVDLLNGGRQQGDHLVHAAAQRSLASLVVSRLPNGYEQMLGRRFANGVNLSGGEWQKVALARAYLRNAQVLVLDEPTSSLDARAEYEVFQQFAELLRDRMVLLISHRFSTVRMADRIVVLRDGRIIEEGAHDELVASSGLYAELFAMQAEGYR